MLSYIKKFSEINKNDLFAVGGKNSSLGEMFSNLSSRGIQVPDGFATTAFAFEEFLTYNHLHSPLHQLVSELDVKDFSNLTEIGARARQLLSEAQIPENIEASITEAYRGLCGKDELAVAVRSSATAEDLPEASFAGQHDSFLNIKGASALLKAIKRCYVSLYTDRAIKYREDNHFAHEGVSLSVGVQLMVRSDKACSGVIFTLEPETGFRDVIHISGVWGLGENIVQGTVIPDEFLVFKPTMKLNKNPIIQKKLGEKAKMMIYGNSEEVPVVNMDTEKTMQNRYVLEESEILKLAEWALIIEEHYQKPMDIEWAKDGISGQLFIIQARPETVHSRKNPLQFREFHLLERSKVLAKGEAIGSRITTGTARVLHSPSEAGKLKPGEILITDVTSPDWDPILKNAGAIITDKGGRTSHASIVARELGVPAIVGCGDATGSIADGDLVTISCCEGKTGYVYQGTLKFREDELDLSTVRKPENTHAMLIIADPDQAFRLSFYPNDGVGLLRMEFIVTHSVKVHPMALVNFDRIKDPNVADEINSITFQYADKRSYFVEKLSEGIATIAAAFYPKDVILRTSDFKTNEYASLIGGKDFEPKEENPMLGFRGASRYYNELYSEGFRLECEAIRRVRDDMGFTNVKVMIPFCRTVEEGRKVIAVMKKSGLEQGVNDLEIYVMAEIPSNVILAEKFAEIFDGFSIGSNDLTQLVLGVDRDSSIISDLFSEENEAVKDMIATVISKAKAAGRRIGLCGQAPSDLPEFAAFLIDKGIDSISFGPDAFLRGINNLNQLDEHSGIPVPAKKSGVAV